MEKEDDILVCKSLEFKNTFGQKIKVMDIPVLTKNHRHFFMVEVRLQSFISLLYHNPQEKSSHSFREHLKRKMSWTAFIDLYSIQDFKNNA
ncbi:DUF2535 family protein [Neobacillus sp. DY30]|uniref:DUF2535 family protein n=1 Tax=Neobacillus sp. DY30 TaxID=3047871 RepID=UPI0024C0CD21|nr:DUF2535 family protein [Neobacillus sp. DY30]WHY00216.1 DUF2535 family protein [Neobacillus sp. DY30]